MSKWLIKQVVVNCEKQPVDCVTMIDKAAYDQAVINKTQAHHLLANAVAMLSIAKSHLVSSTLEDSKSNHSMLIMQITELIKHIDKFQYEDYK